jgi:predicted amino acid dehydrogenase
MKIERRPLLSLFATGKIAPVHAAALGYLPSDLLQDTGLSRSEVIRRWCDDLPTLSTVMETSLGRIAVIRLPRFSFELYNDQQDLVRTIVEALEIAARIGARTVSLAGLLPSATDYGRAVATAISGRKDLPTISTGHATTASTVVLTIRRILEEGGRNLARERVGFLGMGSIGPASLRLMLKCLPHPVEIILCDVYRKLDSLETIRQELVSELGFRGAVRILESRAEIPPELYDATLIIGATNVPEILDINRVTSGTMIVDDSAPHCFTLRDAIQRFRGHEDILFTEGGVLRLPHPIDQLRYLSLSAEQVMNPAGREAFARHNPFQIGGCVFSGLLSSCFEDLEPTVGLVDGSSCLRHYERLGQLGFQAADLHGQGYVLPEESIRNFRARFGRT